MHNLVLCTCFTHEILFDTRLLIAYRFQLFRFADPLYQSVKHFSNRNASPLRWTDALNHLDSRSRRDLLKHDSGRIDSCTWTEA